ncbi:hypothetical protein CEXT_195051 [Caerostris extrusa]|uniref:Uncharacterized protein n=1 Tax=Caerostris extrusa TaxID=172846 RepID=A0AAV4M9F2_CAEEX|nr:hypothetical protein CEXT_195051 [Caerostris extrusa]
MNPNKFWSEKEDEVHNKRGEVPFTIKRGYLISEWGVPRGSPGAMAQFHTWSPGSWCTRTSSLAALIELQPPRPPESKELLHPQSKPYCEDYLESKTFYL